MNAADSPWVAAQTPGKSGALLKREGVPQWKRECSVQPQNGVPHFMRVRAVWAAFTKRFVPAWRKCIQMSERTERNENKCLIWTEIFPTKRIESRYEFGNRQQSPCNHAQRCFTLAEVRLWRLWRSPKATTVDVTLHLFVFRIECRRVSSYSIPYATTNGSPTLRLFCS